MAIFLWRDKNSKLHILGSLHFLPPSAHPLPEQIGQAYESSSRVIFEARLDKERDLDLGWLPGERLLSDIIDEELALAARGVADELGADFESLKRLRPWAFVNDLIPYQLKRVQATSELGIDRYLFDRAENGCQVLRERRSARNVSSSVLSWGLPQSGPAKALR